MSDQADLFWEASCGVCRHWQPLTGYIPSGRMCRNPDVEGFGLIMKYLDGHGCRGFQPHEEEA